MNDTEKQGRGGIRKRTIRCADCGSVEVYVAVDGWYCPPCDNIVKVERT